MLDAALDRYMTNDEGGLLFFYYSSVDLCAHMMWRHTDEEHPHHDPVFAAQDSSWWSERDGSTWKDTVMDLILRMDPVLGHIRQRIGEDVVGLTISPSATLRSARTFSRARDPAQRRKTLSMTTAHQEVDSQICEPALRRNRKATWSRVPRSPATAPSLFTLLNKINLLQWQRSTTEWVALKASTKCTRCHNRGYNDRTAGGGGDIDRQRARHRLLFVQQTRRWKTTALSDERGRRSHACEHRRHAHMNLHRLRFLNQSPLQTMRRVRNRYEPKLHAWLLLRRAWMCAMLTRCSCCRTLACFVCVCAEIEPS